MLSNYSTIPFEFPELAAVVSYEAAMMLSPISHSRNADATESEIVLPIEIKDTRKWIDIMQKEL